jgi:hypothetical protein
MWINVISTLNDDTTMIQKQFIQHHQALVPKNIVVSTSSEMATYDIEGCCLKFKALLGHAYRY